MKWKLNDYLEANSVKPRSVENRAIKLGYTFGRNSIYRMTRGEGPTNINRDSLTAILHALRDITQKDVQVSDLLEYED